MLERLAAIGIGKNQILHTVQSLFYNHAPATLVGLFSCQVDRRHKASDWGATMPPPEGTSYEFRFTSLQAMADAHTADAGG